MPARANSEHLSEPAGQERADATPSAFSCPCCGGGLFRLASCVCGDQDDRPSGRGGVMRTRFLLASAFALMACSGVQALPEGETVPSARFCLPAMAGRRRAGGDWRFGGANRTMCIRWQAVNNLSMPSSVAGIVRKSSACRARSTFPPMMPGANSVSRITSIRPMTSRLTRNWSIRTYGIVSHWWAANPPR